MDRLAEHHRLAQVLPPIATVECFAKLDCAADRRVHRNRTEAWTDPTDCIEEVAEDRIHISAMGSDVHFDEAAEYLFVLQVREQSLKRAGIAG